MARWFCSGLLGWTLAVLVMTSAAVTPASAQPGFDRPGGDYLRFVVPSADPAVCAARCDRDNRCRAWTFAYPNTGASGGASAATCWLKNQVPPAKENKCCVSGVKGGGLGENRPGPLEHSIDRYGGDLRAFDIASNPSPEACQKACEEENRCRAWTYARPGYVGAAARCYLKDKITRPRRKPCCVSGVVR